MFDFSNIWYWVGFGIGIIIQILLYWCWCSLNRPKTDAERLSKFNETRHP